MIHSRRKSDRALVAGLVVVIFLLLAALAVVVSANMERTRQIHRLARNASSAAENTERLVERYRPCLPAEPESPACVRQREAAAAVDDAIGRIGNEIHRALANGLEAHDLNAHIQHEDIRALLLAAVDSPPPAPSVPREPITTTTTGGGTTTTTTTAAPAEPPRTVLTVPPPPPPPVTAPPIVPSPTIVAPCPTLPNGRCHPGRNNRSGR